MEHPTTHYEALVKSIDEMKPLIRRVNPLFCETPLQALKVRSYILLSHAALEEYLEDLCKNVAGIAVKKYRDESKITRALLGLISSGLLDDISIGKAKKKVKQDLFHDIEIFAGEALTQFYNIIKNNNGIKKANQLSLLLPIGVDPESTDSATLAALDAFGTKRGDVAHKAKIVKEHTLSEIDGDLTSILAGLKLFDQASCNALQ